MSTVFLIHKEPNHQSEICKTCDCEEEVRIALKKLDGYPYEYDLGDGELHNPIARFDLRNKNGNNRKRKE